VHTMTTKTMADFVTDILDYSFMPDADYQYLMRFAQFHHTTRDPNVNTPFWIKTHEHNGLTYSFVADQCYIYIESFTDSDMEPRTSDTYRLVA